MAGRPNLIYKSCLRELNPKPIAYEAIALPIELRQPTCDAAGIYHTGIVSPRDIIPAQVTRGGVPNTNANEEPHVFVLCFAHPRRRDRGCGGTSHEAGRAATRVACMTVNVERKEHLE